MQRPYTVGWEEKEERDFGEGVKKGRHVSVGPQAAFNGDHI